MRFHLQDLCGLRRGYEMFRTAVLGTLLAAAFIVACGQPGGERELRGEVIAEGEGPLALRLELDDDGYHLHWDDQEGESAYRISGTATYWPRCAGDRPSMIDEVEFGDILVPDITEYTLPKSSGGPDFFLKELTVDVSAVRVEQTAGLDEEQQSLPTVHESMALTAEPLPCE
jgi:hypothetical protein